MHVFIARQHTDARYWYSKFVCQSLHLANHTIYRHSYYRRRIGNRTQAFEWHQFQWSWVISKPYFKITVFQGHGVILRPLNAIDVLCAQLTCDLFAIAKFLLINVSNRCKPPWFTRVRWSNNYDAAVGVCTLKMTASAAGVKHHH